MLCSGLGPSGYTQVEKTVSERKYLVENARLSLTSYCAIPFSTAPNSSFLVRSKTMESLQLCARSNLHNLGCNVLDWGPLQASCTIKTPPSHFSCSITLIVTRLPGRDGAVFTWVYSVVQTSTLDIWSSVVNWIQHVIQSNVRNSIPGIFMNPI